MIYLLIAIFCGSLFSVLFRVSQKYGINTSQVILFNYVFAALVSWVPLIVTSISQGVPMVNPFVERWCWLALMQGFLFLMGFTVMDASTLRNGVALTTVAARASLVLSVILCWILLAQPAPSWLAVGMVVVALLLLILPGQKSGASSGSRSKAWIIVGVFFFYGISDFSLKMVQRLVENQYASTPDLMGRQLTALSATIFLMGAFLSLQSCALSGSLKRGEDGQRAVTWKSVGMGSLLGLANMGCTSCILRALGAMPTGMFYPLYNVGNVVLSTIFGVVLFRERFHWVQILGFLLAGVAIVLFFR